MRTLDALLETRRRGDRGRAQPRADPPGGPRDRSRAPREAPRGVGSSRRARPEQVAALRRRRTRGRPARTPGRRLPERLAGAAPEHAASGAGLPIGRSVKQSGEAGSASGAVRRRRSRASSARRRRSPATSRASARRACSRWTRRALASIGRRYGGAPHQEVLARLAAFVRDKVAPHLAPRRPHLPRRDGPRRGAGAVPARPPRRAVLPRDAARRSRARSAPRCSPRARGSPTRTPPTTRASTPASRRCSTIRRSGPTRCCVAPATWRSPTRRCARRWTPPRAASASSRCSSRRRCASSSSRS